MKKRILIAVIAAVAVCGIGVGVYAATNQGDTMYQAGKALRDARDGAQTAALDSGIVATYKGKNVTRAEIEYQRATDVLRAEDAKVGGRTDAEIAEGIIRGMILLEEAQAQGLSATEEEIEAMVSSAREAYALPEGKEQLDAYFDGAGITAEEYFEMIRAQAPEIIARQKLKDAVGKKYCEENGLEFTKIDPPEELQKAQEDYIQQLFDAHADEIVYHAEGEDN